MPEKVKYDAIVEDVLCHCIFAVGSGARMHIKLDALIKLREHVRSPFHKQISRAKDAHNPQDVDPGMKRWDLVSQFLLGCCETIGALAAANAIKRGSSFIELKDLKKAYNVVSKHHANLPGVWCPEMN